MRLTFYRASDVNGRLSRAVGGESIRLEGVGGREALATAAEVRTERFAHCGEVGVEGGVTCEGIFDIHFNSNYRIE